jgi:copper(I)-binding protein
VVAGYAVIENRGARPVQVVGARAAGFLRAEVHETYRDGDRMRMRPRPSLELAPGARLELAPGGLHLMLFDPARPVTVGAVHELTLTLADGRALKSRATVRDLRDAPP